MQVLDGVTTSDQYSDAATIAGIYPSNGGSFSILNEPVYASTQTGVPGNFQWSPDIPISPGTGFTIPAGCTGIRFRSYTPGAPANVSAWIAGKADAAPQGGTPGKVTLTALNFLHNGTLVANEQGLNLVDANGISWTVSDDAGAQRVDVQASGPTSGLVNADGTIAGGTRFTVNHSATGTYQVTFTSPFSAAPAVLVTLANLPAFGSNRNYIPGVSAVTVNGFTLTVASPSGVAADAAFNFAAQPVS